MRRLTLLFVLEGLACAANGTFVNRKILQESNPDDLLPDGKPGQWLFTRGTLKIIAARIDFPNNAHPPIPAEGSYNLSSLGTNQFFLDSSWGKLNLNFTFAPNITVISSAEDSTSDSIKTEALQILTQLGYSYCGGPCGTAKANAGGEYDALVLAFAGYPPSLGWAGLGMLGTGLAWVLYPMDAAVLENAMGQNFGMVPSKTTKTRVNGIAYNTPQVEGFSRIAGGGHVEHGNEQSRYNSNGHFDPSSKHWFGWLEDADVVFMHPVGASAACPQCVAAWSGKLNAFDRPDVIPGRTTASSGSTAFAIRIAYTPTNLIYVYYRTSYPSTRVGVSVQYCRRTLKPWLNSGAESVCYTFDAAGDTETMDDSAIPPNSTYVVAPPAAAVEDVGLDGVAGVIPVIRVISVPSFADCPNMVCPPDKDISALLSVSFLSPHQTVPVAFTVLPSANVERQLSVSDGPVVFAIQDAARGAGGRGAFNAFLCPRDGLREVALYVYDAPPFSAQLFGAPPGYGAINRFQAFAFECCEPGEAFNAEGVRAVVIRQLDPQPISIAELEVYLAGAPGVNVASQARCWSLPAGGLYYGGDEQTGRQYLMTDGDITTFSHSGGLGNGKFVDGVNNLDMCVFDKAVDVLQLTVWPRQAWVDRSQNLRVEAYAFVGSDLGTSHGGSAVSEDIAMNFPSSIGPNPSLIRPIGLLWNRTITMTDIPWSQNLTLPSFAGSQVPCGANGASASVSFPVVQGSSYGLVVPGAGGQGSVRLSTTMTTTTCPVGAYMTTQALPPGIAQCLMCPATALGLFGEMATCPSQTCTAVVVSGNYTGPYELAQDLTGNGSFFGMDGPAQPGIAHYTSAAGATISWNESEARFDLRDSAGRLMATRSSLWTGKFDGQAGWSNLSTQGPFGAIQAVGFELNEEQNLNLCEIEMYGPNGTNLLLFGGGACYSLPTYSQDASYWYTADRTTGMENYLNDGCTASPEACQCAQTGSIPAGGAIMICVLNEPAEVNNIKAYYNEYWTDRVQNVNLKIFSSMPSGPVTLTSLANPTFILRGLSLTDHSIRNYRIFSLCYLSIQATSQFPLGPSVGNISSSIATSTSTAATAGVVSSLTTAYSAPIAPMLANSTSMTAAVSTACPSESDLVCCTQALKSRSLTLLLNLAIDAALVSVEIQWTNITLQPSADALAANTTWENTRLTLIGNHAIKECSLLDSLALKNTTGFIGRQLICGTAGRQVALSLPSLLRPAVAAGVLIRMCLSLTTNITSNVTVSMQSAPGAP